MARASLALALMLTLGQCTLTRVDRASCSNDVDCRDALGIGFECVSGGFCEQTTNPRCNSTFPVDLFEDPGAYRGYMVLGAIFNGSSDTQTARANAAELVVSIVNDRGGVAEGTRVALVRCDNQPDFMGDGRTRDEASVATALWLTDTLGAVALVGPSSSAATQATFEALGDRDVLLMSPAATSPALTDLDHTMPTDTDPGLLWRTAVPDTFQARAVVADLRARGVQHIALVHSDDAYGEGLAHEIRDLFVGTGEMVEDLPFAQSSSAARTDAITNAGRAAGVEEVIFVSTVEDAAAFLAVAEASVDYATKDIFLTDAAANEGLFATSGVAFGLYDRVRGTRPGTPSGAVNGFFLGAYQNVYEQDPTEEQFSFVANAYDATFLVLYGAVWAAANETAIGGMTIARGIRQLSSGADIALAGVDWSMGVSALQMGTSIDVEGASGQLDYDPATEETTGAIDVWGIDTSMPNLPVITAIRRYEPSELVP